MNKKSIFKQCSCYETEGDNINCPVHYPRFFQLQMILAVVVTAVIFIGFIILSISKGQP